MNIRKHNLKQFAQRHVTENQVMRAKIYDALRLHFGRKPDNFSPDQLELLAELNTDARALQLLEFCRYMLKAEAALLAAQLTVTR